ncbi:PASTA domain-containing protein [Eggerthellaceae bacterium 3-80]|nr:PASTA domain-containing protein [bacterium D16-34]
MICPQCHTENRPGAKYCNECGLPLPQDVAETIDATQNLEAIVIDEDDQQDVSEAEQDNTSNTDELTGEEVVVSDSEEQSVEDESPKEPVANDMDLTAFIPVKAKQPHATDLSGIDECLVDSSYVPPQPAWRNGDTVEMPRVDEQQVKQREYKAPGAPEKKSKKGKVGAIIVVILALAVVIALAITHQMEMWGGKSVPDVVGITQSDAEYILDTKGFAVTSVSEPSDEAEGLVLHTDPAAGAREEGNLSITLYVSTSRLVPDVAGLARDEAVNKLAEDGFENVEFASERSNAHEGLVLSVSPEPGTRALSTDAITLTIAEPFTVPDVIGKTVSEATQELEVDGYMVATTYTYDDSVEDGTVLSTDPEAQTKLASGETVTINVSKSRAIELEQQTQSLLEGLAASGEPLMVDSANYIVLSVNAVTYEGNNATSFVITGKLTYTAPDGETITGDPRTITGYITWTDDNYIETISATQN